MFSPYFYIIIPKNKISNIQKIIIKSAYPIPSNPRLMAIILPREMVIDIDMININNPKIINPKIPNPIKKLKSPNILLSSFVFV